MPKETMNPNEYIDRLKTSLPSTLLRRRAFVCYRNEKNGKKKTDKVPYNPNTRRKASPTDLRSWSNFEDAAEAYLNSQDARRPFHGISFALDGMAVGADLYLIGLDLDNCLDPTTGELEPFAQTIIEEFRTYCEISPSGTGLRVFALGNLPVDGRRKGEIEVYKAKKFLSLTGNVFAGSPTELEDCTEAIEALYESISDSTNVDEPITSQPNNLTNDEILNIATKSSNGEAFKRLWDGDESLWKGRGSKYNSQSEADLALASYLAFYTGGDRDRMDELFRESKLYRKKWETKTYREKTLHKAASGVSSFYSHVTKALKSPKKKPKTLSIEDCYDVLDGIVKRAEEAPRVCVSEVLDDHDAVTALARILEEDLAAFEKLKINLNSSGVLVKEIDALSRAVKAERSKLAVAIKQCPTPREQLTKVSKLLPGAPVGENIVLPVEWHVSFEGVFSKTPAGIINGEPAVTLDLIAPAPVLITGRAKSLVDNSEQVELAWFRDQRWQRKLIGREIISQKTKIVSLASDGMPVTSRNAAYLVNFLAEFEAANIEHLPQTMITRQMGWQGPKGRYGFLTGDKLIAPNKPSDASDVKQIRFVGADKGDDQIVAGFHKGGTFEGWLEAVEPIAQFPKVQLVIYSSFAPPLLEVVQAHNFTTDVCGPTSEGKSTTQRVGVSIWGNPDEHSKNPALWPWNSTQVFIENALVICNGHPVFLDDTKLAIRKDIVSRILYAVASGSGRKRGSPDGIRHSDSFRTNLISSGEDPATSFTGDGGQHARTLVLWGSPFGGANEETGKLVNKLNMALRSNHGHAGPEWVRYIVNHREEWPSWREEFQEFQIQYLDFAKGNPVAIRMAETFALLEFTGWKVHEALPLPWDYQDTVASLYDSLMLESSESNRAAVALQQVMSWATSNQHLFIGRDDVTPYQGHAGKWDPKNWEEIAFYPHHLNKLLQDLGFQPAAILRTWRDKDWIVTASDRGRFQKLVSVLKEKYWMVVIRRSAIEEVQNDFA